MVKDESDPESDTRTVKKAFEEIKEMFVNIDELVLIAHYDRNTSLDFPIDKITNKKFARNLIYQDYISSDDYSLVYDRTNNCMRISNHEFNRELAKEDKPDEGKFINKRSINVHDLISSYRDTLYSAGLIDPLIKIIMIYTFN